MPGFPAFQNLSEFAKTHIYWVGDVIKPSHHNKGKHNKVIQLKLEKQSGGKKEEASIDCEM